MSISEEMSKLPEPEKEGEIMTPFPEKITMPSRVEMVTTHSQFLSRIQTESQFFTEEPHTLTTKRNMSGSKSPWSKRTATEMFKPVLSKVVDPATPI